LELRLFISGLFLESAERIAFIYHLKSGTPKKNHGGKAKSSALQLSERRAGESAEAAARRVITGGGKPGEGRGWLLSMVRVSVYYRDEWCCLSTFV
jgi:hypothetical protein